MGAIAGRAVAGFAWVSGARIAARLVDLVVLAVLARLLSPAEFGLVALATAFIAILQFFQDLGLLQAFVQRPSVDRQDVSSLFWGTASVSVVLTLLVVAAAPLFGQLWQSDGLTPVLVALAPMLLLQGLALVPNAELQRSLEFRPTAVARVSGSIFGGATGIALALAGWGVFALVMRVLVDNFLSTVLVWVFTAFRPGLLFSWVRFWDLLRFGIPVAGSRLLETVQSRGDVLLIGRFMGSSAVGVYTVAYQLFRMLMELLAGSAAQVLTPAFSRLQFEYPRLRNAYYSAIRVTCSVAIPVFAGIAALGDQIVILLFGPAWADAVPVLQLLAILGVVQAIRYYDATLLIAVGRPKLGLLIRSITVTVTIVGYIVGLQTGSLEAFVVVQIIVALVISTPIWFTALWRVVGVSPVRVMRVALPSLTSSIVMWGALATIGEGMSNLSDVLVLVICVPVGALIYAAILSLLDRCIWRDLWGLVPGRG